MWRFLLYTGLVLAGEAGGALLVGMDPWRLILETAPALSVAGFWAYTTRQRQLEERRARAVLDLGLARQRAELMGKLTHVQTMLTDLAVCSDGELHEQVEIARGIVAVIRDAERKVG